VAVCQKCGSQLNLGVKFCAVCGTRSLPGAGPLPPLPGGVSASPGSASGAGAQLPAPMPAAKPAPPALLVARTGQAVAVTAGMSIGRDPGNTLFVDVHDVSRRHATIVTHGVGWAVMDQGSRNGTFVNDQQVLTVTPIYHADRLRFGATAEYALHDPAHPRPAIQGTGATTTVMPPIGGGTQQNLANPAGLSGPPAPVRLQWPKPPLAEGHVVSMRGPLSVEKDGKVAKAFLSVGLGLINPALAFLPWAMGKNQVMVTVLRVKNLDDNRHVAVTLLGDTTSIIDDGDLIAVWGRVDQGTIYAVDVYNYTTSAMIRFKK